MQRILVAGTTGTGKTTVARTVAERLDLPRTELDALFHGPGWTPRPEFLDEVRALAASERWVTEWQYPAARPLLAARAELIVWLDLPVRVTMRRLVRRTVRRRLRREELWNGNLEAPLWTVLTDDDHVVRWAWSTRHLLAELVPAAQREHPHLEVVRLRTQRAVDAWLATL
ncbi:AAA family ATPase [Aeromicrobium sp. Root495]|uniref:AAA family ATPase n=1 Tax=Aeromicrobium sp. Root495 TaxID=1736550 RepID=UPI000AC6EBEC|nr:AAA family ATPase [Aeromicrobium sp. Root495]